MSLSVYTYVYSRCAGPRTRLEQRRRWNNRNACTGERYSSGRTNLGHPIRRSHCSPPYEQRERERDFRSVCKYNAPKRAYMNAYGNRGAVARSFSTCQRPPLKPRVNSPLKLPAPSTSAVEIENCRFLYAYVYLSYAYQAAGGLLTITDTARCKLQIISVLAEYTAALCFTAHVSPR